MKVIVRAHKQVDTVVQVKPGQLLTAYRVADEDKSKPVALLSWKDDTIVLVIDPWQFPDWEHPKDEHEVLPGRPKDKN
jgi:hypothetical protein